MSQPDSNNRMFHLAADYINHTNRHIFLTGKAGTGKTTFLKYIRQHTSKNTVVVAPTGVAAINAGGVTMHSFFQLPFGPYVPSGAHLFGVNNGVTDAHALFRNIRFNHDKKELLREMELLIIDEVSMVRADTLDAIDAILRHFRNQPLLPFGGVQVLYIGDLFQLPPVMPDEQWQLLKGCYESVFFFHARVMQQAPPLFIELNKIYRQNEATFINLLNGVRNSTLDWDDLEALNQRYLPHFTGDGDQYIVLTTHNRRADEINNARLAAMPGGIHTFTGEIKGDFSDKALPTDMDLRIKQGAQVMFIKNDVAEPRRYFNGKLATVKEVLPDDKIVVVLANSEETLVLEKETWRNIRYSWNKTEGTVDEEELGSFTQYPIRLAWAITIHKSQGLTFEKAIIDAGNAFAPGQVYVALSRCTSLEGLVLHSRIHPGAIRTDEQVLEFSSRFHKEDELEMLLEGEKMVFWAEQLLKLFSAEKILAELQLHAAWLRDKKMVGMESAVTLSRNLQQRAAQLHEVGLKFRHQLDPLLKEVLQTGNVITLSERVGKAVAYFTNEIYESFIQPVRRERDIVKDIPKIKKYVLQLSGLEHFLWGRLQLFADASYGNVKFNEGLPDYETLRRPPEEEKTKEKPAKKTREAGDSRRGTLELFLTGKTLQEIATERGLAVSTVESHLADCVANDELQLNRFMDEKKIALILPVVKELGSTASAPIKARLGETATWAEIRAVQAYYRKTME
ncbi:helix-turn-helix domain-containing protein [Chitinophaga ginsengisoli]|uniref:Helicase-like protein n=1 Tax=Chitinophaga ginsengisoli TaxID=363837 RepID=A0A2P8GL89_9BACT|nr:helix-turn-helix domain-containing protein [Chitinophaga ginsengisoli]PSL34724.1 helicase-like protein [Chitinophaga ginsengisoli]